MLQSHKYHSDTCQRQPSVLFWPLLPCAARGPTKTAAAWFRYETRWVRCPMTMHAAPCGARWRVRIQGSSCLLLLTLGLTVFAFTHIFPDRRRHDRMVRCCRLRWTEIRRGQNLACLCCCSHRDVRVDGTRMRTRRHVFPARPRAMHLSVGWTLVAASYARSALSSHAMRIWRKPVTEAMTKWLPAAGLSSRLLRRDHQGPRCADCEECAE